MELFRILFGQIYKKRATPFYYMQFFFVLLQSCRVAKRATAKRHR